jgi:hypothetical protein
MRVCVGQGVETMSSSSGAAGQSVSHGGRERRMGMWMWMRPRTVPELLFVVEGI